jgi:Fe2+ transport system protein FeoA
MTNQTIKIVDVTSGKELERKATSDEIANYKAENQEAILRRQAQAEKQALKDSANAKLAALGLTPDEIAAITGAN